MKITIDSGKEEFNGEVNLNEAKITSNSKKPLYTESILNCVGVVVIEKSNEKIRRGLAHIKYNPGIFKGDVDFEGEGGMIPTKQEIRKVRKDLEGFVSHFTDPIAILVYNTIKKNKEGKFENPMANYIFNWLLDNNVALYFPNNETNKSLVTPWTDDQTGTYYKNFGIYDDKIVVMNFSKPKKGQKHGIWLNKGDETIPLNINF